MKSNLKDLEDDKTLLEKKEVVNFINKDDIQEILKGDDMNKHRPIIEYLIDRIEVDGENTNTNEECEFLRNPFWRKMKLCVCVCVCLFFLLSVQGRTLGMCTLLC